VNANFEYSRAVERLKSTWITLQTQQRLESIARDREQVLARYQPLFASENIPQLGEADFHSFLLFENNRHWEGLKRHSVRLRENMERLRQALGLLVDESLPLDQRLGEAIKRVPGLGLATATAVMLVAYPAKYAVWNNASEGGLRQLGLWPKFSTTTTLGQKYVRLNEKFVQLAKDVGVDLWTLDHLWRRLDEKVDGPAVMPAALGGFSLERHLQEFLWDNWEKTVLGQEWVRHVEPGNPDAGLEFPCDVGRIDLLARHKQKPIWLVIELQRGQSGDAIVGQVLRYMGWVKQNLAKTNESVSGMIVAPDFDPALQYAVSAVADRVRLWKYDLRFELLEQSGSSKKTSS